MEVCRGLGRSGIHWRREIERAELLTGGDVVGEIRHLWGRDRGVLALGKLGTSGQCFCAAWPELWCVGTACQQRRRGAARRSEARAVALGLGMAAAEGKRKRDSGSFL